MTTAPQVASVVKADFEKALNPGGAVTAATTPAPVSDGSVAPRSDAPATVPAAPLQFQEVPNTGGADGVTTLAPAATSATGGGTGIGIEVISPAHTGAPDPNGGLKAVGPENAAPLAPIERAGAAPSTVNEISAPQAAAQAPKANGKKTKPEFDKADESSSKHKKKKGLKKINPF